jgi:phage-related protein
MIFSDTTYNGITFSRFVRGSGYMATVVNGDQVGIRDTMDAIPGVDGVERYKSFYGDRLIEIKGFVKGSGESDLYTKINALKNAFDINVLQNSPLADDNGFMRLLFTDPGQSEAYYLCKPIRGAIAVSEQRTGLARGFSVLLEAKDPHKYSSTVLTITLTPATSVASSKFPMTLPVAFGGSTSSATATINNTGGISVFPSEIKIYGPCNGPSVENTTDGKGIYFTSDVVLLANEYLTINPSQGTCIKTDINGTQTSVANYLTSASVYWQLLSGNNTITFSAQTMTSGAYAVVSANITI